MSTVPEEPDATGSANSDAQTAAMVDLRDTIRTQMGGSRKVERIHADGRLTIREHIDLLVDAASFQELGTFVAEPGVGADLWALPGDGIIGGLAAVDTRQVVVAGYDDTVRRGTSGPRGGAKLGRLYEIATRRRVPFVILGQSAGSRLPEGMDPNYFAARSNGRSVLGHLLLRERSIPVVVAIVGPSFGSSSFYAGLADFVVQLDGTCLALTSPRVVEAAVGERVDMEQLGGPRIHDTVTGQIDRSAQTPEDAARLIRQFLSYLPAAAGLPLPVVDDPGTTTVAHDARIAGIVPARRTRAYDVKRVIRRLVDDGEYLELKPRFSESLVTALGRFGGVPAGIIANQPMRGAGALTSDACRKATRLLCLCDAFGLPVVYLCDTPGFLVGTAAEHGGALARAMQLLRAGAMARVPKCTVILRKAFGLGFTIMGGSDQLEADLVLAWPGAEIGFMDPKIAANVLHGGQAGELTPAASAAHLEAEAAKLATDFAPYGVASSMAIDEIIEPASTRRWLVQFARTAGALDGTSAGGPLRSWSFW